MGAQTKLLLVLAVLCLAIELTQCHSWMVKPSPLINNNCRVDKPGRQIIDFGRVIIGTLNCPGPCEDGRGFNDGTPNRYQRGQTIRVGWLRNGHGLGGGVRWSIVNVEKNDFRNKQTYTDRTFAVECFVRDLVDCGGACGTDTKRYESNLRIPNTLPDGKYRLQWIWFGGPDPSSNGNFGDYYNCADVYIQGGALEATHRVNDMPTCYTISTRVGDCAQEPCRTGEQASFKKLTEVSDGKTLGSQLWGGNGGGGGGGGGNPPPAPPAPGRAPGPFGRFYPSNGGTFQLHPLNVPDLCLDASAPGNGAVVYIHKCHNGANQKWTVQDTGNGIVLVNRQSGRALDMQVGPNGGLKGQLYDRHGGPNQRFHVRDLGNYEYGLVVDQGGSKLGLDVEGHGTAPGTRVQQWNFVATPNQRWLFTAA